MTTQTWSVKGAERSHGILGRLKPTDVRLEPLASKPEAPRLVAPACVERAR